MTSKTIHDVTEVKCEQYLANEDNDYYICAIDHRATNVDGKEVVFHEHIRNVIGITTDSVGFHNSLWDQETPSVEVSFRAGVDGKVSCEIKDMGLDKGYHKIECHKEKEKKE